MKRVLFVDDEQQVLDGLRRMLYFLRDEWKMVFADSGTMALKLLSESPYDVLVTDVRMPGMSGIELLGEVANSYPDVLRIVLSGTADHEITLRTVNLAHQYLLKPCDPKVLRATIERALNLRLMLEDSALRRVIASLPALPSLPTVYVDLMQAMDSPDVSASAIGAIVARDIGMVSKVLQLVNSAFFGSHRMISDPVDAVVYLGFDTIRALALQVDVFSQFDPNRIPEFSMHDLQRHSARVAANAKLIATNASLSREAVNDCIAGGFLHDIGKLVLAASVPDRYRSVLRKIRRDGVPLELAELEEFGATHSEIGAYLLWLWGIPDVLTEIVALHHNPPKESALELSRVAVVHLANLLDLDNSQAQIEHHCRDLSLPAGRSLSDLTAGVVAAERIL